MNKACAAGTGSFIDEMAEMLGVSVTNGEFADLAFSCPTYYRSGHPLCAPLWGRQCLRRNVKESLKKLSPPAWPTRLPKTILSKVVGTRKLGKKVILTGAVFYNKAVVSAFQQQLPEKTCSWPSTAKSAALSAPPCLPREY